MDKMPQSYDMRFQQGAVHLLIGKITYVLNNIKLIRAFSYAGPVSSGKTTRASFIIKNKDILFPRGSKIKNICYAYSSWQPEYTSLKNNLHVTTFIKKIPSVEEFIKLMEPHKSTGGSLLFIDDMMNSISNDLVEIATIHARHNNCSLFIMLQNFFNNNASIRQIRLNSMYLHIFSNPHDNLSFSILCRQILGTDYKWLVAAFRELCVSHPYACLLIDLTQKRTNALRIRTNIFPHQFPMTVYMKKGTIV